jgi:hypothetical protein
MAQYSTTPAYDARALSASEISDRLKALLETKHIYQSIIVDFEPIIKGIDDIGLSMRRITELEAATRVVRLPWTPVLSRAIAAGNPQREKSDGPFDFFCQDVKLFCERCQRVEPFGARSAQEIFCQSMVSFPGSGKPEQTVQVFTFSIVCQSCKGVPEVFVVRREGPTLILEGRAPAEHIDVPIFIPLDVRRFYANALVAHHSGQTLAANVLLRYVIEQWARKAVGGDVKDAGEALEKYVGSLPRTFEAQFPTLKDTYASLDKDVESAGGSSDVFEIAVEEVLTHFDARRLLKLPS